MARARLGRCSRSLRALLVGRMGLMQKLRMNMSIDPGEFTINGRVWQRLYSQLLSAVYALAEWPHLRL